MTTKTTTPPAPPALLDIDHDLAARKPMTLDEREALRALLTDQNFTLTEAGAVAFVRAAHARTGVRRSAGAYCSWLYDEGAIAFIGKAVDAERLQHWRVAFNLARTAQRKRLDAHGVETPRRVHKPKAPTEYHAPPGAPTFQVQDPVGMVKGVLTMWRTGKLTDNQTVTMVALLLGA